MQYNIESTDYAVELSAVNLDVALTFGVPLDVTIGESAQLDVGEAVNYIKSGQAEIAAEVDNILNVFNANATEKTRAFNVNVTDKTTEFNNNASAKTTDFNDNAISKTDDFNANAATKTDDFNDNYADKLSAFNDNATDKTDIFNLNAVDKTTAYNDNASTKTTAFNSNYTAKKALIDAEVANAAASATVASNSADLAKQWAIGNPSEPSGNSAKYWAEQAASTYNNKANIDLSNLSASGEVKFDAKQDTLVSGTNIKTINGNSLLGSGNIEIQGGGGAYTAGDGIDITSNTISIKSSIINGAELGTTALQVGDNISDLTNDSGYIQNVATGTGSLTILGTAAIGNNSVNIGKGSKALATGVLALGYDAIASANYAIQLGRGTNSTAYTFSVGFATVNYQLLDGSTGLIPDARLSSNILRSADLSGYATENWVNNQGYLTGITSSDVTSALGYTPYNATNPNGYITSSALSGYALDADVVHLTGTQSISGTKTFLVKTNMAPIELYPVSSGSPYIDFHYNNSTSDYTSRIIEQASGDLVVTTNDFTINANAFARASDTNGSIVTTVNKSKATNGYFQLGNGMIVNWGYVNSWTSNAAQVTFSKAFTTTRQVAIARSAGATTTNDGGDYYVRGISNTGFDIYRTSTNTGGVSWIAIGY